MGPSWLFYANTRGIIFQNVCEQGHRSRLYKTHALRFSNALNNCDYKDIKTGERGWRFVERILWLRLWPRSKYPSSCPLTSSLMRVGTKGTSARGCCVFPVVGEARLELELRQPVEWERGAVLESDSIPTCGSHRGSESDWNLLLLTFLEIKYI